MSKLFAFLLAVVLMSGAVYAQHINEVTSDGNDNDVYVEQKFNGGGGAFDGNEAYIKQLGNLNDVQVYQENNAFAGSADWTKVDQIGHRNDANVWQANDGQVATVKSTGNDNEADVYQNGNKNTGDINQKGDDNYGTIYTQGVTSNAEIVQDGDNNSATQDMGTTWGKSVLNSEFVAKQYGNNNISTQHMEGDGSPGSILALSNEGFVLQDGHRNTAIQDMTLGGGAGDNANNDAWLKQMGNDNTSMQYMKGNGNMSTVKQFGNMNNSVSLQN